MGLPRGMSAILAARGRPATMCAPSRSYRRDALSNAYQRTVVDHAAEARARSQAKLALARGLAAQIVAVHGNCIVIEDCSVSTWTRLWGRAHSVVQPRHADRCSCGRVSGQRWSGSAGRHPYNRASASAACADSGCPKPWPSARISARTADYRRIVTSSPQHWQPAFSWPTLTTPAPLGSITYLPTPCGRGWPRSKRRGPSQPVPATRGNMPLYRPGPAATTGGPCWATRPPLGLPSNSPAYTPAHHESSRKTKLLKAFGGSMTHCMVNS